MLGDGAVDYCLESGLGHNEGADRFMISAVELNPGNCGVLMGREGIVVGGDDLAWPARRQGGEGSLKCFATQFSCAANNDESGHFRKNAM